MLKFQDNPPMTPPGLTDFPADQTWWVAHTKARNEKALAFDLLAQNVGYYLPMTLHVTVSGGRKRKVLKPLFTSYVFFWGTLEDRVRALATNRLCQTIPVTSTAELVEELTALSRALAISPALAARLYPARGQRCRITAGPFEGIEGIVIRDQVDRHRFVLQVSMLGQGAEIEIEPDLLEPVTP